ncbi:hypothetical protein WJX74_004334 [Apatococcus lobatus]|uniref:Uncharacterized protein n=1 Tax=Apatococcus lobatus TaxID=904363 RepID=A0AAW1RVS6_9CHLO
MEEPFKAAPTVACCALLAEEEEVQAFQEDYKMAEVLSSKRAPRPMRKVHGTTRNPFAISREEEVYPSIVQGVYAAANDACKALGINAVFGSTRGTRTPCHLVEQVEEEATYAALSTKVHWTFMKRGPSPSELHISRTYNAQNEPVGPILVALATWGAERPPILASTYPDIPPESKWVQASRSQQTAAVAPASAQTGATERGPRGPNDPDDHAAGNGAGSHEGTASLPPPSKGTRSKT